MHNLAAVGQSQSGADFSSLTEFTVSDLITFVRHIRIGRRLKELCSVRLRKGQKGEGPRWKLLLWTAVAALFFGLIGAGELPEDMLRSLRNSTHVHKASGDIVLVAIDDRSLREFGRWPWPRRRHAEIINKLSEAGAKRTFVDIIFNGRSDPSDDEQMAKAISKAGNVTLAVSTRSGVTRPESVATATRIFSRQTMFSKHAQMALISVAYNYQNAVWRLDYSRQVEGKAVPSFAAKLGHVDPNAKRHFHARLFDRPVDGSGHRSRRRAERKFRSKDHPGQGHRHRHRLGRHRRSILHSRPGARWPARTSTSSARKR